jgi:DMSO reductase anchor subunit
MLTGDNTRVAALLTVPLLGSVLVALASRRDDLYRLLVHEDSAFEWAQVAAFAAVVVVAVRGAPQLWGDGDRTATLVVAGLAAAALVIVGEELSWGQRLLGFDPPAAFAANRQGESTLHNEPGFETASRVLFLLAGVYGTVMPLVVRRPSPFVPPRALVGLFAVVAAYFVSRLVFLQQPTYAEAKYSEWPELCLAVATAAWCASLALRGRRV